MERPRAKGLTSPSGPVVVSEKTLRALLAIRKERLLPDLFGRVVVARSVFEALRDTRAVSPEAAAAAWLDVRDDCPDQPLPERVASASSADAATLRLALSIPASLVLIEGPIKDRAKLSFIKCEGTLSLLVRGYREGKLSAVRPMVKALQALGHGDVLPEPAMLDALWKALEGME